jgi:hypothetical protein
LIFSISMPRKEYEGLSASVYLPTKELMQKWKEDANAFGSPLSEYILEMAERGRHAKEGERPDITREYADLKTLCRKLEDEVKMLKMNLESSQAEIYKLRFKSFERIGSPKSEGIDPAFCDLV